MTLKPKMTETYQKFTVSKPPLIRGGGGDLEIYAFSPESISPA